MVSSTVYGVQSLLDQIFGILQGYGYRVWMSCKGTIPVDPNKTSFRNCLDAVDECDAFLGLITGSYGSGVDATGKSITHREIVRSITQNKLRWFLVHRDVTIARQLLKQFRFTRRGKPKRFRFRPTSVLDDTRVLEMYERAVRLDRPYSRRTGNWVQPYTNDEEALVFIRTQFESPARIRGLLPQYSLNRDRER